LKLIPAPPLCVGLVRRAKRAAASIPLAKKTDFLPQEKNSQELAVFFYACNFLLILVLIVQRQMREG
jgi:hypothetical protein